MAGGDEMRLLVVALRRCGLPHVEDGERSQRILDELESVLADHGSLMSRVTDLQHECGLRQLGEENADRTTADIQRLADVVMDYMERNGTPPMWATETLCRMLIKGGE
jgi:hypothetical protein